MAKYMAATDPKRTEREIRNEALVRGIAAEGMVLLENRGALPMELSGRRVALFGNGARHTVSGGTGSGEVNTRHSVTVERGFINAGAEIVSGAWLDRYDSFVEAAQRARFEELSAKKLPPPALFWLMTANRFEPAIPLEEGDLQDADIAVYILARNSGEGSDRKNEPGDYQLTDTEKAIISALGARYGGVTVVLNVGGVIDTEFLRTEPNVNALLLMGQCGIAGGDALADVISGVSEPSGRLATTWAARYEDYPNAERFSYLSGDVDDEYYTEGVFVGYRWFDSFNIAPAYPFGYGLGYGSFKIEAGETRVDGDDIVLDAVVANTGAVPSREVVQVYVSAPAGKLPKPCQELRAFAKTKRLMPGETEDVKLTFPIASMASFDEERSAWVLEAGEYTVRIGKSSREAVPAAVLTLSKDVVTEYVHDVLRPDRDMECIRPDMPPRFAAPEDAARISLDSYTPGAPEERGKDGVHPLVDQLTLRELAELCVGADRGVFSTIGTASLHCPGAAGDTASIPARGIRNLVMADGPAGLRLCADFAVDDKGGLIYSSPHLGAEFAKFLYEKEGAPVKPDGATEYYQYCTAIPIATVLAQSWDVDLVRRAGDLVGGEMEELGVDIWLAPGMNIHRNPLCGRNFEYYSEDPLVSGLMAAADTLGVQSHSGRSVTIKHFCCNNCEDNRMFSNSHVTQRALREIYLRGFEIAVKTAAPKCVMTSYNLVNGVHSANSRELLTTVLRDEWGFGGFVMTDWGTTNGPMDGASVKYPCSDAAMCVAAGNDLVMPGSERDVSRIASAVENGELSIAALRECASRIIRASE